MEGLAARVLGEGSACRGGVLHLSGESVPQEGLPGLPEVCFSFCCLLAAIWGPLKPSVAGLCMLKVLEQIPPPASSPEAPPALSHCPDTHGPCQSSLSHPLPCRILPVSSFIV